MYIRSAYIDSRPISFAFFSLSFYSYHFILSRQVCLLVVEVGHLLRSLKLFVCMCCVVLCKVVLAVK